MIKKCHTIIAGLLIVLCSFCMVHPFGAADRFRNNGDGTITDLRTGLMWVEKDNGFPISWPAAVQYCKTLQTGGFNDWRMPNLSELASLYAPKSQNTNGYHTFDLITTTAQSCWSSDTQGYLAGRFNFAYGKEYWLRKSYSGPTRVLAVRDFD